MSETSRSALMSVPPRRAETLRISLIVLLAAATCGYWLLHAASTHFSQTIRSARAKPASPKSGDPLAQRIRAIAKETNALETLVQWRRDAEVAQQTFDLPALMVISQQMTGLIPRLANRYAVQVKNDPKPPNGLVRDVENESGKQPATSK